MESGFPKRSCSNKKLERIGYSARCQCRSTCRSPIRIRMANQHRTIVRMWPAVAVSRSSECAFDGLSCDVAFRCIIPERNQLLVARAGWPGIHADGRALAVARGMELENRHEAYLDRERRCVRRWGTSTRGRSPATDGATAARAGNVCPGRAALQLDRLLHRRQCWCWLEQHRQYYGQLDAGPNSGAVSSSVLRPCSIGFPTGYQYRRREHQQSMVDDRDW